MRTPNLATVQYFPEQVPEAPEELSRYLTREFEKIRAAITALSLGHLDITYTAPTKPRDGDIRYADGTKWKPNGVGGVGIWYYNKDTALWVQLG